MCKTLLISNYLKTETTNMAPSTRRRPTFSDNQTERISEVDLLKKQVDELETALEECKEQKRHVKVYRQKQLGELRKVLKKITRRLNRHLKLHQRRTATFEKYSERAKKRSVLLINREERMRRRIEQFGEDIKTIKVKKDRKKNRALVERERKKKLKARTEMLEAEKDLRKKHEDVDGEPKAWRSCQICNEGYSYEGDNIPRVLECGHTICESCVRKLHYARFVECPYDRISTFVYEDGIGKLPKNCAVLHL